jgi:hypothetical protein
MTLRCFLFLPALLLATPALAQSNVLTGTISDASTKQPLSDVVVTATSPNLQGEQVVVTDTNGAYRIPQLPPGNYSLRFEKESFQPYSRAGIQLRMDRTIRVNVELLPTGITDTVMVHGAAPTINVGSTSTGVNVGADFVRQIAVANPSGRGGTVRSFESLAETAPGASADTHGASVPRTSSSWTACPRMTRPTASTPPLRSSFPQREAAPARATPPSWTCSSAATA